MNPMHMHGFIVGAATVFVAQFIVRSYNRRKPSAGS